MYTVITCCRLWHDSPWWSGLVALPVSRVLQVRCLRLQIVAKLRWYCIIAAQLH